MTNVTGTKKGEYSSQGAVGAHSNVNRTCPTNCIIARTLYKAPGKTTRRARHVRQVHTGHLHTHLPHIVGVHAYTVYLYV